MGDSDLPVIFHMTVDRFSQAHSRGLEQLCFFSPWYPQKGEPKVRWKVQRLHYVSPWVRCEKLQKHMLQSWKNDVQPVLLLVVKRAPISPGRFCIERLPWTHGLPMRPWDLCYELAHLCLDEFFAQAGNPPGTPSLRGRE